MDAATDINIRIALHVLATAVAFAAVCLAWRRWLRLSRRDFLAAAALYWALFALGMARIYAPTPSHAMPVAEVLVYAGVLAGIVAALKCRLENGVSAFAASLLVKILLQIIFLRVYEVVVQ